MSKYRINLVTMQDVQKFIEKANSFPKNDLLVQDNENHQVSAQSLIGMIYTMEWDEVNLYSKSNDPRIYTAFEDFIVNE